MFRLTLSAAGTACPTVPQRRLPSLARGPRLLVKFKTRDGEEFVVPSDISHDHDMFCM